MRDHLHTMPLCGYDSLWFTEPRSRYTNDRIIINIIIRANTLETSIFISHCVIGIVNERYGRFAYLLQDGSYVKGNLAYTLSKNLDIQGVSK